MFQLPLKNLRGVVPEEEIFDLIYRYHNIQINHSNSKMTYSQVKYCLMILVKILSFSVVNCVNDCYCILLILMWQRTRTQTTNLIESWQVFPFLVSKTWITSASKAVFYTWLLVILKPYVSIIWKHCKRHSKRFVFYNLKFSQM